MLDVLIHVITINKTFFNLFEYEWNVSTLATLPMGPTFIETIFPTALSDSVNIGSDNLLPPKTLSGLCSYIKDTIKCFANDSRHVVYDENTCKKFLSINRKIHPTLLI